MCALCTPTHPPAAVDQAQRVEQKRGHQRSAAHHHQEGKHQDLQHDLRGRGSGGGGGGPERRS